MVTNAINNSVYDIYELLRNKFQDPPPSDLVIYHYTNAAGLKGILESNKLWATNLSFLNDSREQKHGLAIFSEVLRTIIKRKSTSRSCLPILKQALAMLNNAPTSTAYTSCFTLNGNQLSQWRGYSHNQPGFSIGFRCADLLASMEFEAQKPIAVHAIYEFKKQMELAQYLVEGFVQALEIQFEAWKETTLSTHFTTLLKQLCDVISVQLKDPGFQEESEYRVFVTDVQPKNIKIRESNGMLIPYTEFRMRSNRKLPITQIIVGPGSNTNLACHSAQMLLEKEGYDDVKCIESLIPFRLL